MTLTSVDIGNAIPAFARKYGVSCSLCHAPAPRLTAFGEKFAANGFAMSADEEPRDTIDTGDEQLRLLRSLPLSIRLDMFASATAPIRKSRPSVDLQTPWGIKLLSGGEVAKGISYYMYFFLTERGEVAGLEDAFVQFTNIAKTGVSLLAGQFQVSDPLFKRELRLEYDDYQAYRVRVGEVRADMTYDRGLMALYSPAEGTDVALMLLNGQGIDAANSDRMYDRDNLKNYAARLSQDFGVLRVGGFGYLGQERKNDGLNHMVVFGPDVTLGLSSNIEFNGQFLRRSDDNPGLNLIKPNKDNIVDSWFTELVWNIAGPAGKWHAAALYNNISGDQPFTLNGNSMREYRSASASLHYLARRNVRFLGDLGYDLESKRTRLTAGAFMAW